MKVVCVGDCGVDHYLPSNERLFGGISANFSRHARREFAGDDAVHLVSVVGDDDGAELVLAGLRNSGIECHIDRLHGSTPVQYIEVQADGERSFVRYDEGVLRDFRIGAAERELIAQCDLLVAPVYLQIVGLFDDLMSIDTTGLVAIDFADFLEHPDFSLLEKHLAHIDVGFFGLSVADGAAIEQLGELAQKHDKLFVVTLGAAGSLAFQCSTRFDCDALTVPNVVDTTGAGDAFAAAFLASYCHGGSVLASMQRAARLAAEVVQRQGTM